MSTSDVLSTDLGDSKTLGKEAHGVFAFKEFSVLEAHSKKFQYRALLTCHYILKEFIISYNYQRNTFRYFLLFLIFCYYYYYFCFFMVAPTAYRGSQARGQTGATATGLYHSHSHGRSELCLQATPQLMAMPDT